MELRNSCSVKVGGVVVEGMMMLEKVLNVRKGCSTCVKLKDRTACTALPVPPPDLEVPTPEVPTLAQLRFLSGGLPNGGPPLLPSQSA